MKPHLPHFIRGTKKNPEKNGAHSGVDSQRAALAIATVVILSFLLSMPMLPSRVSLKLGDTCPDNITARKTVSYRDVVETDLRREKAAASVGKVYDPVPNAADQAVDSFKTIFHTVADVKRFYARADGRRKVARIREQLGPSLAGRISGETFITLLAAGPDTLRKIEEYSMRVVSAAMGKEIRDEVAEIRAARAAAASEAMKLLTHTGEAKAVAEISQASIRPNRVFDEDRTAALQDKARRDTPPVYKQINSGDLIIAKGEAVTREHIQKFEALGLRHPTLDYKTTLSLTLLVIMAVWIVAAYLMRYHNEVYSNTRALLLLSLIVIVSTLALRVGGSLLGINLTGAQVGFLGILWVVTASMFMTVLLNPQVAVVITALLSIVLSLLLNNELRFAASALITSLVAIYSVANIRDRHDLMRAGGLLAGAGALMVWITGGIGNDSFRDMLVGSFWAGVVIPAAASLLFLFGTAPLERPFGRTTHISLLELADTNKTLLRRLVMEAPGTYAHSMTVGHLAETAAEAIGADSLAARVASYYHDIGKIRRPHFFIENQNVDENAHDKINPTLSALVITSHIKDGIDIAKEYRVPKVVLDVIAQHHGTSLVQYFFTQMAGEQEPSTALEQQFRYPGPKPRTKEAAVVMLADAVEAARRGLSKPTPAKIETLVNRIVADKLRDSQLDESELTFKDLSKITDCFVRTITSLMHARIEYPDSVNGEDRKPAADADSDSELAKDTRQAPPDSEHGPKAATG